MSIKGLIRIAAVTAAGGHLDLGAVRGELLETIVNLAEDRPKAADGVTPLSTEEIMQKVRAAFEPIADVQARAEQEIRNAEAKAATS